MAKKTYEESDIQNIANSIRTKTGSEALLRVSDMSRAIDDIGGADLSLIVKSYNKISPYLYKRDVYFNNGTETSLTGYDTYFIPLDVLDFVSFDWDISPLFYGTLSSNYIFSRLLNDDTIVSVMNGTSNNDCFVYATGLMAFFIGSTTTKGVYFTVKRGNESYLRIGINNKYTLLDTKQIKNSLYINNDTEYIKTRAYIATDNKFNIISGDYSVIWISCKTGDIIKFNGYFGSLSWRGTIRLSDDTAIRILNTTTLYEVEQDCSVGLFYLEGSSATIEYIPIDAITVDSSNIIGDINVDGQYNGLSGVAFGTSLTYRAQTTYGYLQYLPNLCGATIDNQGVGSSTILGNMLTVIKNYTGYSDKRFCILEGFVNDWYLNKDLGSYTDDTELTVCGCVRSALNYMLSQNANLTIFLVLDPYGRLYGGVDCSSPAVNSDNLTQYEYYEEISKVAESLGIPVIKLYAISGVSENTPQYLIDNIHHTALGASQVANAIWYQMRNYPINEV